MDTKVNYNNNCNSKYLSFHESLLIKVLSGAKRQTRRRQHFVIDQALKQDDIVRVIDFDDMYYGKAKIIKIDTCDFLKLPQSAYKSRSETFLEYVESFMWHNGPVDIYNEHISIIDFKMVEDCNGNQLKLTRKRGIYSYLIINGDKDDN